MTTLLGQIKRAIRVSHVVSDYITGPTSACFISNLRIFSNSSTFLLLRSLLLVDDEAPLRPAASIWLRPWTSAAITA